LDFDPLLRTRDRFGAVTEEPGAPSSKKLVEKLLIRESSRLS
jgi:hypothetical protein